MPEDLRFRPHHLLCALGYQGKGYSDTFTRNMTRLVTDGLNGPDGGATRIRITVLSDDICAPCPKRCGTRCTNEPAIARLDARHARALGLTPGDTLTWDDARRRIRQTVAPGDLAQLCDGCQWLELGLCEAALRALHDAD